MPPRLTQAPGKALAFLSLIAALGFNPVLCAEAVDASLNRFKNARAAQANAHMDRANRVIVKPKGKAKMKPEDYRNAFPIYVMIARKYADTPSASSASSMLHSLATRFPNTTMGRQATQIWPEQKDTEARYRHTIPAYIQLINTTTEADLIAEAQSFLRMVARYSDGDTGAKADAAIRKYHADKEGAPEKSAAQLLAAARAPLTARRGVNPNKRAQAVENIRKIFIHFPTTPEAQEAKTLLKTFTEDFSKNKAAKKAREVFDEWSPRPPVGPNRPPVGRPGRRP